MAGVKFKITAKGFRSYKKASQEVFNTVKDAMEDIKDDIVDTSESLAPHKTGKLEKSHRIRRNYKNLQNISFTIAYSAMNKGFDYAEWTHNAKYNLGAGSRAKQPKKSRFSNTAFRVGRNYLGKVVDGTRKGRNEFIQHTIDRKMAYYWQHGKD